MNEEQQSIACDHKRRSHRSYANIRDAARQRQGLAHDPFGTAKVEARSLGLVDTIHADANVSYRDIELWADTVGAAR
ncbi:MAG: hypothetical protein OXG82_04745 [Gammaproteobacteria bacterium]|nr:hypothetical protein [Gammaproteobacteria bacterium]